MRVVDAVKRAISVENDRVWYIFLTGSMYESNRVNATYERRTHLRDCAVMRKRTRKAK